MKLTKEFIEAVRNLDAAFAQLEAAWDDNHDNSIKLSEAYPFECSLAEMAIVVGNWRDAVETDQSISPNQPRHPFVTAFHIYEQGEHIIESLQSGRTFKKEWSTEQFPLDVRQTQYFDPEEIRNMWITYRP